MRQRMGERLGTVYGKVIKMTTEPGCYGDGALGHQHTREACANYDRKAIPESPYATTWSRDGSTAHLWDCIRQQWLSVSYQSDIPSDVWPTLKDSERYHLQRLPEQREEDEY